MTPTCPTCGGKGFVPCYVIYETQLGDEEVYDSCIGRFYGDPENPKGLKRNQHVGWGVWDCPGTDDDECPVGGGE